MGDISLRYLNLPILAELVDFSCLVTNFEQIGRNWYLVRFPQKPPDWTKLFKAANEAGKLNEILVKGAKRPTKNIPYIHWDKLRRLKPPNELSHEEWWLGINLRRIPLFRALPLKDKHSRPFKYFVPDATHELLHEIDLRAGGTIGVPEQILNAQTRDRYLVSSLMDEGITSSILEGAVTTRERAKEFIRSGRKPKQPADWMVLNNYRTMRELNVLKDSPLSMDLLFRIHSSITQNTLKDPDQAGRFRRPDEEAEVADEITGEVFHIPPPAEQLEARTAALCDFANVTESKPFIHPVIRAIILHFWLAYDHPFVDGNGRTARALFYWSMLRAGFWLFEFISISKVLVAAPAKYYRSFLYSETDDNDLNYFIIQQAIVIQRALKDLDAYIEEKTDEIQNSQLLVRTAGVLNHRQQALINHAFRHPGHAYTVESHRVSQNVAYDTARNDLRDLADLDLFEMRKRGRSLVFFPVEQLSEKLAQLQ